MAYVTVKDYVASTLHSLKSPYAMTPQYITIHNTANDATARNEIAYMKRNTASTSYHVAIDDKEAIEAIPFNRNAWHCGDGNGDGNRKSIGIEICYSRSGGAKYAQAEANAIEYTAQLLKKYGWGIDRVRWHRDWSGKNCPHRILDEGRSAAVRKAIADRLAELTKPKTEVAGVTNEPQLNADQEAVRKKAMELGITDGKNPFRNVNQYYVWNAMIPFVQRLKALENKSK
ncbi:N-acetylmuramoyl-L-alanine amidase family protein [Psychrobacillus sp. OK032]|uniref:peptidoglycan recognition protein family protein n=1 Tax=Psychrobacillus sp. OK032 TaxID=1884358 RepID=UPI0008AFAD86|nr:N-acetylmuramoyl-L-alanine amidase [Psychrobacillus sp. OK032]